MKPYTLILCAACSCGGANQAFMLPTDATQVTLSASAGGVAHQSEACVEEWVVYDAKHRKLRAQYCNEAGDVSTAERMLTPYDVKTVRTAFEKIHLVDEPATCVRDVVQVMLVETYSEQSVYHLGDCEDDRNVRYVDETLIEVRRALIRFAREVRPSLA